MDKVQAENYISIIRTAIFKKPFPLSNPDCGSTGRLGQRPVDDRPLLYRCVPV